jgi:hypothetical protein
MYVFIVMLLSKHIYSVRKGSSKVSSASLAVRTYKHIIFESVLYKVKSYYVEVYVLYPSVTYILSMPESENTPLLSVFTISKPAQIVCLLKECKLPHTQQWTFMQIFELLISVSCASKYKCSQHITKIHYDHTPTTCTY